MDRNASMLSFDYRGRKHSMMEFCTGSHHVARKRHMCILCGEYIQPGERYFRFAGKYDGDFFDHCFHPDCDRLIDRCVDGAGEWSVDEVYDWIRECVCWSCPGYNEDLDGAFDCTENIYRCEKVLDSLLGPVTT